MPGQFHSLGEMIQDYEKKGNSHLLNAEEKEQVIHLINQMKETGSKSEKEEFKQIKSLCNFGLNLIYISKEVLFVL